MVITVKALIMDNVVITFAFKPDWFHQATASGLAIPGIFINMLGPQTIGTMISITISFNISLTSTTIKIFFFSFKHIWSRKTSTSPKTTLQQAIFLSIKKACLKQAPVQLFLFGRITFWPKHFNDPIIRRDKYGFFQTGGIGSIFIAS